MPLAKILLFYVFTPLADPDASAAMVAEIDTARKANESLGGEFEVIAFGLVPGIGSHTSWEERLDGRLAQAIMSIQALKGVSIGDGFALEQVQESPYSDDDQQADHGNDSPHVHTPG